MSEKTHNNSRRFLGKVVIFMNFFVHIKNCIKTRKYFKIMKKNLKQYMRSGDKSYFPSDGGVYEKIYALRDYKLIEKYQKLAGKILRPEIEKFLNDAKGQPETIEKCVNIDDYVNMTKQDIYEMGRNFVFPVGEQVIINNTLYYAQDVKRDIEIMDFRFEMSVIQIVPEYDRDIYKRAMPPLPIEYIYVMKQLCFKIYADRICPGIVF